MASGPQHYRMAEAILKELERNGGSLQPEALALSIETAKAYGLLALTAAIAIKKQSPADANEWRFAVGVAITKERAEESE